MFVGADHQVTSVAGNKTATPAYPEARPRDATEYFEGATTGDPMQMITLITQPPPLASGTGDGSAPNSLAGTTRQQNSCPSTAPANTGRAKQRPGQEITGSNSPQMPTPPPAPFSPINPLGRRCYDPRDDVGDIERLERMRAMNEERDGDTRKAGERMRDRVRALIVEEEMRKLQVG